MQQKLPQDGRYRRKLPIMDWLTGYERNLLRYDLTGGLITAAVVIPKAMAYATIAGLPVQVGLYTAFIPMIIYAIIGASRPLSVSTTTTLAILVAAELGEVVPDGNPASLLIASSTLSVLVGLILLLAFILRLGFIANFISEPVLVGFKAGIGVVIVLDQIPKLLGIQFAKGTFFHNIISIFQSIPNLSMPTFAVGMIMIILLVGIEKYFHRLPAPLIVVAAGIAGMSLFELQNLGVAPVGYIPPGLPSLIKPDLLLVSHLWPGALGIALMSFTETIAAGRAFSKTDEPAIKPNRELLATGLANACSGLFGAMASGGGTSQTAVNRLAGARTQMAELFTALTTLLTMLFLAPVIGMMPQATLAAVVIIYSIGLINPADFRAILNIRKTEFLWALTAFAGVILLGTLKGILVAIILSLVALAKQVTNPAMHIMGRKPGTNVFRPLTDEHPEDETFPGLLILKMEGRVFFANAGAIGEKMRSITSMTNPKVVVLDMSGVFDLEYTALKMLIEGEKRARENGIFIWLVGLNPEVLEVVQRSPLGNTLGRERMHFSLEIAVAKYLALENSPHI